MKIRALITVALLLASCATHHSQEENLRAPSSSTDLTGNYLGEGLFSDRTAGLHRPAIRLYLERAQGETDSYYGVIVEYAQLLAMAPPYLASQKVPVANKVIGYLNRIATRVSAYKLVPGEKSRTYEMHTLEVHNGQIVPAAQYTMVLNLDSNRSDASNPLADATITGNSDGKMVFPGESTSQGLERVADAVNVSQYHLAKITYKKGHLTSTWRGNWEDLEGSYLSEYGRFKDGVLELYSENGQKKSKFIKTTSTKAKYFTNPKSAPIEGDYVVIEPIPKMYLLTPTSGSRTASDVEMTGRIGLFLDVFDGSAPEAGSHLVTELAYTNPQDPKDFMMYYEHPQHLKNVGVATKK